MHYACIRPPAHLCVVCRFPEDVCNEEFPGVHIYDGIDCPYVVYDDDLDIHSYHLTATEAQNAMRASDQYADEDDDY